MGDSVKEVAPALLLSVGLASIVAGGASGCSGEGGNPGVSLAPIRVQQTHTSAISANPDHTQLAVVHPDADSVSILDLEMRTIRHEVLLAGEPPAVDADGRYAPSVEPRALAFDSTGSTLYVTGQQSGKLYAVELESGAITGEVQVCSEPIGVLLSADDANVFVACAQDDEIVEVSATSMLTVASAPCPRKPWALAWGSDGATLYATHFLGPGLSRFSTAPLALAATIALARGTSLVDDLGPVPTEPHGEVRGLYDALVRPGTSELWTAHLMLGIDTPQPKLDFQRTVFPSLSILDTASAASAGATELARLSVTTEPGDGGAFGDIVSGPRALAFSPDGKLAAVADAASEDVLIVDAERRVEAQLVRPLPGHMPDGVLWVGDTIYVAERNTEDIAAFVITGGKDGVTVAPSGSAFPTLSSDPMPAELRLGQHLFHSANSDELPVTQNHWVACASCHLEGRSDAVTWRFSQGPRDTPSNAGGLSDTGFLFRTADRTRVQDYARTINIEQGGHFASDQPSQGSLLDALAAFVNHAISTPVPPSTDAERVIEGSDLAALRAQGEMVFNHAGCATCHSGPARTDSGAGNPALDLSGPIVSEEAAAGVLLHDVGTCVTTGDWLDVEHEDRDGHSRAACAFDTPQLRGLVDSAPYLHDGSAATLDDAVTVMLHALDATGQKPPALSAGDRRALLEFLRGL